VAALTERAKKRRLLPIAAAIVLGASLALNVAALRQLVAYRHLQPPEASYRAGVCPDRGLVAHFAFDEIHGRSTPNAAGPVPGTLHTAVAPLTRFLYGDARLVPGRVGQALELRARQWVAAGNNDCFTSDQISLAAWIWQETDDPRDTEVPTIVSKSHWPVDGFWLATTTKGLQKESRYLDLGIAWGSGYAHVESGYLLPLREWHHVAVAMDNTRHEVQFYVDGKPEGPLHEHVPAWLTNWDHELLVGDYDGSCRWPWYGKLDDVRVYNRVVTAGEVATIYRGTGP
jgi:hypothetical protein